MRPTWVPCAGAVVVDGAGRLLLVRRGRDPGRGLWSVPGGRVERGESAAQAAVREVAEETGLAVVVTGRAGVVHRPGADGVTYVIEDLTAAPAEGADPEAVRPGDDAEAVGWFTHAQVHALDRAGLLVDLLAEALVGWGLLSPVRSSSGR